MKYFFLQTHAFKLWREKSELTCWNYTEILESLTKIKPISYVGSALNQGFPHNKHSENGDIHKDKLVLIFLYIKQAWLIHTRFVKVESW